MLISFLWLNGEDIIVVSFSSCGTRTANFSTESLSFQITVIFKEFCYNRCWATSYFVIRKHKLMNSVAHSYGKPIVYLLSVSKQMRLKGEIVKIDRSKILRIPFSNDIPGFVGLSKRVIHDDSCYECLSFTLRMKSES